MIGFRMPLVFLAALLTAFAAVGGSAFARQEFGGVETGVAVVGTCDGGTIELNGDEERMLELHNGARAGEGLPPLCVNPVLTEAARAHAQEMLDAGYFSHDSANGEGPDARLMRYGYAPEGYSYWAYGENIAWGSGPPGAPESRFEEWMDSDDHRANILDERFREVGIGARTDAYGEATTYTVDFGVRR